MDCNARETREPAVRATYDDIDTDPRSGEQEFEEARLSTVVIHDEQIA